MKRKNKEVKNEKNQLSPAMIGLVISLVLISLFFIISFAYAQSGQDEASLLEQELSAQGYDWLVNYTLNSTGMGFGKIDVYEFNQSRTIATFDGISSEGWYKIYLSNLSDEENYSQSTFDLFIRNNNISFDYVVDPQINPALETGLVALYHFNNQSAYGENDTKVYDFAGGINNGTVYGGAVWNSSGGILGTGAFQFTNGSIYIKKGRCPQNMSYIDRFGGYCIDQYEASMPSANSTFMGNSSDFARINNPGTMTAVSQPGVVPWVSIRATNAKIACINAGKHLCNDSEWLGAANIWGVVYDLPSDLAVAPYKCITSSSMCAGQSYNGTGNGMAGAGGNACNTGKNSTGSVSKCVSAEGVYDMVGNVWEWTNNTVDVINPLGNSTAGTGTAGAYYINTTGVRNWSLSNTADNGKYGKDYVYFPVTTAGRAVSRGGSWNSGANAGVFSAGVDIDPANAYSYIGFRCCRAPS